MLGVSRKDLLKIYLEIATVKKGRVTVASNLYAAARSSNIKSA